MLAIMLEIPIGKATNVNFQRDSQLDSPKDLSYTIKRSVPEMPCEFTNSKQNVFSGNM